MKVSIEILEDSEDSEDSENSYPEGDIIFEEFEDTVSIRLSNSDREIRIN